MKPRATKPTHSPLTPREEDVLLRVIEPDKQAASEIGISIFTLRNHWREIYRKTGTRSRTGALLWLLRQRPLPRGTAGYSH